jgi:hypothetical protein
MVSDEETEDYIMLTSQQIVPKKALEGKVSIHLLKGEIELDVQIDLQAEDEPPADVHCKAMLMHSNQKVFTIIKNLQQQSVEERKSKFDTV